MHHFLWFIRTCAKWSLQDRVWNLNSQLFSPQKEFNIYLAFFSNQQSSQTISTSSKFVLSTSLNHTVPPSITTESNIFLLSLMSLPLTSNKHLISPEPPVWADGNCIVSPLRPGCLPSICERAYCRGSDLLLHYFNHMTHIGTPAWSRATTLDSWQLRGRRTRREVASRMWLSCRISEEGSATQTRSWVNKDGPRSKADVEDVLVCWRAAEPLSQSGRRAGGWPNTASES